PAVAFIDERLLEDLVDLRLEQTHYFEARHRALANCLGRLSLRDREMISARYGSSMSAQELSTATGRSLEAVYKSLGRIRMALAKCIDGALKQESGV
ncbi:MAG: sigma factor-like helix-turn-helix DNA-binding protein, partial [Singulisphaera sp.]